MSEDGSFTPKFCWRPLRKETAVRLSMPLSIRGLSKYTASSRPMAALAISCTVRCTSSGSKPLGLATSMDTPAAGAAAAAAPAPASGAIGCPICMPWTCSMETWARPWSLWRVSFARMAVCSSPISSAMAKASLAASMAFSGLMQCMWSSARSATVSASEALSPSLRKMSIASRAACIASPWRAVIICTWLTCKSATPMRASSLMPFATLYASLAGLRAFSDPRPKLLGSCMTAATLVLETMSMYSAIALLSIVFFARLSASLAARTAWAGLSNLRWMLLSTRYAFACLILSPYSSRISII
mmetsp:Transcript_41948/g.108674  ORF Transcript_41948/g.108674 Transcript_41948/m.108674 type:complete len:301 (+) Transcript_41948:140-1042(+)